MKKFFLTAVICMLTIGCMGSFNPVWATTSTTNQNVIDTATKEMYYQQYIEIAKEISQEMEMDISVLPIEKFQEQDWRTPDAYRKLLTKVANWDMTIPLSKNEYTSICTKCTSITEQGNIYSVHVTGQFSTQYDDYRQRQLFANVIDVSSNGGISNTQWSQTGYEYILIDGARTCEVVLSGDLTIGGTTFHQKLIGVEFGCSARGGIS